MASCALFAHGSPQYCAAAAAHGRAHETRQARLGHGGDGPFDQSSHGRAKGRSRRRCRPRPSTRPKAGWAARPAAASGPGPARPGSEPPEILSEPGWTEGASADETAGPGSSSSSSSGSGPAAQSRTATGSDPAPARPSDTGPTSCAASSPAVSGRQAGQSARARAVTDNPSIPHRWQGTAWRPVQL